MAQIPTDWRSVIYRGIESEEIDYKAAVNWSDLDRCGKAKFVRHCMAMANTKGGYIVVGVGEDKSGRPCIYKGLTDKQSKSFDPTDVGNFVNRFADPEIDFDVERPVVDGKRFAVFVIRRFSNLPHVCGYGCESELQQGTIYIRTAEAASRPAYRASEIHGIIQRALRNQRELLGRMLRGVLYENRQSIEPDARSYFSEQVSNSKKFYLGKTPVEFPAKAALLEIAVAPGKFEQEKFGLSELKQAIDNSTYTLPDAKFIPAQELDESFFTNVALRSFPPNHKRFWQAFQSGLFHYFTLIPKQRNTLMYLDLVKLVAEAVHFFGQYYSELGYDDELLNIKFELEGVENVALNGLPDKVKRKGKKSTGYKCRIPEIKVKLERSVADLVSGPVGHSIRIIKEICERFNLPEGRHHELERVIKEYLGQRGD